MRCFELRTLLIAYRDRELEKHEGKIAEKHLVRCDKCRYLLKQFTDIANLIESLRFNAVEEEIWEKLWGRIADEKTC